MQKSVKTAVWCRSISPEDEEAILQVICPLGRTYHLLLAVYNEGKIARRKREYPKHAAVWCRSIPWRWRSHIASHLSSGENMHITYSWQYIIKGRLQEGKENTQNCSFRMTLISLGPSSKSHINTETLQNKQLYSNQDAIYERTATLIEKESPNAARL